MCADELDHDRLPALYDIGVDQVSWKRQHNYLTLVADHRRGKIVWGTEGAGEKAADQFFAELDPEITGPPPSARRHAPQAVICIDPYHVVQLANKKLDEVRRAHWNELRSVGDQQAAKRFKDARWSLLKKPEKLTDKQAITLARLKAAGGEVWRGYTLKEATRGIFAPGLDLADVTMLIDRLLSRLARSRLAPFVSFGQTQRET